MEKVYGLPLVTATTIFQVAEAYGIQRFTLIESIPFGEYCQRDLSQEERNKIYEYAPATEVCLLHNPRSNKPYTGFRSKNRDWATVFCLLPGDYVPVVIEYKHGTDQITLGLPSGVLDLKDTTEPDQMLACAKREFLEETGLSLQSIQPLSKQPFPASARQSTSLFYPFLGTLPEKIKSGSQRLDIDEDLLVAAISLADWLILIRNGNGVEMSSALTTFLALQRLGKPCF